MSVIFKRQVIEMENLDKAVQDLSEEHEIIKNKISRLLLARQDNLEDRALHRHLLAKRRHGSDIVAVRQSADYLGARDDLRLTARKIGRITRDMASSRHSQDIATDSLAKAKQRRAIGKSKYLNDIKTFDLTQQIELIKQRRFIWDCEVEHVSDDGEVSLLVYFNPYTMTVWGDSGGESDWDTIREREFVRIDEEGDFDQEDYMVLDEDTGERWFDEDAYYEDVGCAASEATDDIYDEVNTSSNEVAAYVEMPHTLIRVVLGHASEPLLEAVTNPHNTNYIHPHWINPRDPCLGSARPLICETYRAGSIDAMIDVLYAYLSVCDGIDSAGREWREYEDAYTIVDEEDLCKNSFKELE